MSNTDTPPESKSISDLVSMTELEGMGAETGYAEEDNTPTMRVLGYVSLFLGLISWAAVLGTGGIVVAVLAVLFGVIAIRPTKAGKLSGIMPAKMGIFLGVGFALAGFFLSYFKTQSLGTQAEKFARNYIEVIQSDNKVYGMELRKIYSNRFTHSMPLAEYYREAERRAQKAASTSGGGGESGGRSALQTFRTDPANELIWGQDAKTRWALERPVRVFHQYHIDRAEVVLIMPGTNKRLQFILQYHIDPTDVGQWHIQLVQPYRELIVSESIL